MWPWTRKTVLRRTGKFCINSQQYIVWIKIIDFSFMLKIIRILSKDQDNQISNRKYIKTLFLISNKNFIWTTLKVIFSIFRFFCTLRFQIFK